MPLHLGLIYTLLYLPIIVLVVMSFNKSKIGYNWGGFSLKWYELLLNNQAMLEAFWHSIVLGLVAATVSTIIGTLTALTLHRYDFRGKGLLNGLLFVVITVFARLSSLDERLMEAGGDLGASESMMVRTV